MQFPKKVTNREELEVGGIYIYTAPDGWYSNQRVRVLNKTPNKRFMAGGYNLECTDSTVSIEFLDTTDLTGRKYFCGYISDLAYPYSKEDKFLYHKKRVENRHLLKKART